MPETENSHPYGTSERVEVVNTHDLKPGDWIWHGQGWARVRDTKMESELKGYMPMENQCLVLHRDLDANQYMTQGYCAYGDVILRVISDA